MHCAAVDVGNSARQTSIVTSGSLMAVWTVLACLLRLFKEEWQLPDCTHSRRHGVSGHPQVVCRPSRVDDHTNSQSTRHCGDETPSPVNALVH